MVPKFIKKAWRAIAEFTQLYTLFSWVIPSAALTAMTAYLANLSDAGGHLVIFYSTGVFAFTIFAYCCAYWFFNVSSIEGKIRFQDYGVVQLGLSPKLPHVAMNTRGLIYNNSNHDIYVQTTDLVYSIQGKTSEGPFVEPPPFVVHSKTFTSVLLPTIKDVDTTKLIEGWLKLRFRYGKTKQSMTKGYTIEGKPMVSIAIQDGNLAGHMADLAIQNISYE